MNTLALPAALAALLCAAVAVLFFVLWTRERARADALATELRGADTEVSRLEERARGLEERARGLAETSTQVEAAFKAISTEAVAQASQALLKQAEEAFVTRDRLVQARLETALLPVKETLVKFEEKVQALEAKRAEEQGGLKEQIAALMTASASTQQETRRLAGALRGSAGAQGRWGEQSLRNVLETAGLHKRFDFVEQGSLESEEGRRRPDVMVRMPGGGAFAVDAKCPWDAFNAVQDAIDDVSRAAALARHASNVRGHMNALSAKAYWDQFKAEASPDFVAMFLPGDGFLAAALDKAPELMTEAMDRRVLIVTPTTLFALCKAVAYGWRVEGQAENAAQVAALGRELYKRLSVMGGHVAGVGKAIEAAASRYNAFVGSLETQVLTQARRFEDLKVDHEGAELPATPPVEAAIRPLTKLALGPSSDVGPAAGETAAYPTLTVGIGQPNSLESKQDPA
jgi:DNA recombination protein RmuC